MSTSALLSPNIRTIAVGIFRVIAAVAAVITLSRLCLYLARHSLVDAPAAPPPGQTTSLLYVGPAILLVILKLAAGLLLIGSCGWVLTLLVRWTADALRDGRDA